MFEKYIVESYINDRAQIWDEFIDKASINGTFLHTRRFLSYHPADRFTDCSYMIYDNKRNLVAVCPGCQVQENNRKVYYSHKGSTYGGIVYAAKVYHMEQVLDILECVERRIREEGFHKSFFKVTPTPFCTQSNDLLQYAFYYKGYKIYNELNLMIDYATYKEDILSNFSQGKRTNVHNCEKRGCLLRELTDKNEILEGYGILCQNLQKYSIVPVHTANELLDLKYNRIPNEVGFFGVYLEDKMIAFAMMFYFWKTKVAHSQYLGARPEYSTLSPSTYIYYCMIKEMKKRGFKKISWGISTEHLGLQINMGLTKSKEAFGSTYCLHQIYEKYYESD